MKILKIFICTICLTIYPAQSAKMNITASFSPSLTDPNNNHFVNTTPTSGYCTIWPHLCKGDISSVITTLTTMQQYTIKAKDSARNSAFFGIPSGYRLVKVVNAETGEENTLKFRLSAFAAKNWYATNSNWVDANNNITTWGNVPPRPCISGGPSVGDGRWIHFAWAINEKKDVDCVMYSKIERSANIRFDEISYAYELIAPNPLDMGAGIYKGNLQLGVGPSQDIDFGDNFIANDNTLDINFTLTVNHELKVTPESGANDVTLYPCYYGSECTKQSEEKNWERWMVTTIPPQKMSGLSKFNISSSGSFTVYMSCGSGPALSADSCPMLSTKSKTVVPVKALLTLPANIGDKTGQRVVDKILYTEKDKSRNRFTTLSFGTDKPGQVVFVIDKKDITEMLKSRPDSWSGSVTLMFDPNLY